MSYTFNPFTNNFDFYKNFRTKIARVLFVTQEGNDSTADGSIHRPFLTIPAAEAFITDNSSTNIYELWIGPGEFDLAGMTEKKSYVHWLGQGWYGTRVINTDGDTNLTNSTFSSISTHEIQFRGIYFYTVLLADIFTAASGNPGSVNYLFEHCILNSRVSFIGRDASDGVSFYSFRIQSTPNVFDSVNLGMWDGFCGGDGGSNYTLGSTNGGAQAFILATIIGSTFIVQSTGNFVIAALIGGASVFLTLDGTTPQVYLDDSQVINGINYLNGASASQFLLLSDAERNRYSPELALDWNPSPNQVKQALDQLANREVFARRYAFMLGGS